MSVPCYRQAALPERITKNVPWRAVDPLERMRESMKLWRFYLEAGGSLDPEPDSQSPFEAVMPHGTPPAYRRSGLRVVGAAEFSRDCELVQRFPDSVAAVEFERPWLKSLEITNLGQIDQSLRAEEDAQRQADREYWQPLKEELEQLRMNRPRRT